MTFEEFMQENGYDLITTFWEDFSIADKYGIAGVKDTYKRAFSEWKDDYKFFTELTLVLNHKIWQHYKSNRELAALYDRLWREADEYIPSLGQLNLMAHHMDELNKAFAYVSASPLSSARYWSSTEYSKVSAWFVSFSNGGTHSNIEYNSYRVRAVIDF